MKYVVVTETGGDVPAHLVERYGLEICPMHVSFGDKNLDDGAFPVTDIFDHYKNTGELPRTSGCTVQDFINVFERIDAKYPECHIIYLAYSSITTCSYKSAQIAAEGRTNISFFDTKSVAAALCLIATNVAQWLEENPDVELPEVEAYVNNQIAKIRMAFIPGGLEFLRAGGRVSNGSYIAAQLLRIKPVIEIIDGSLIATKKLRGSMEKVCMKMLEEFLDAEEMDNARIGLIRNAGLDEEIQEKVIAYLASRGFTNYEWIDTGCVIASHCGPGSFGIASFAK